jgi:hypothetical protein
MSWTSTRAAMRRHLATFGALLAQFSPTDRKRAARAYRGSLVADADDRMRLKLERYADEVLRDPRSAATDAFDPAEIVPLAIEALGRRVDEAAPRSSPALLGEPNEDEARAAAIETAVAQAVAAHDARLQTIISSSLSLYHLRMALDLATKATDMSGEKIVEFVAGLPSPKRPDYRQDDLPPLIIDGKAVPQLGAGRAPPPASKTSSRDRVIERINERIAASNPQAGIAANNPGKV